MNSSEARPARPPTFWICRIAGGFSEGARPSRFRSLSASGQVLLFASTYTLSGSPSAGESTATRSYTSRMFLLSAAEVVLALVSK